MTKTKLLTSLAALALVFSLGACEGDINISIGDVEIGGDSSSESATSSELEDPDESSESSEPGESSSSSPSGSGGEDSDPVATMFDAIANGESFTLETYYYELTTEDFDTLEEAEAATTYTYYTEADIITTYTTDAVLIEYYLYDQLYDVEAYVNDYDDQAFEADLTLYFELDENNALYNTWYGWYGTWQEIMDSPLQLVSFASAFKAGDLSVGQYGLERDYDVDLSVEGLAEALIYDLFVAENWFAYYDVVCGPDHILELLEDETASNKYSVDSTYFVNYDEWHVAFQTSDLIWEDTSFSFSPFGFVTTYCVERDYMEMALYDVGCSEIDSEWAQYLVIE